MRAWLRLLRPLWIGLGFGLFITFLLGQLPAAESLWAFVLLLVGAFAWSVWMLVDLRRDERRHQASMKRFETWLRERGR